jgi:hypothetical protein
VSFWNRYPVRFLVVFGALALLLFVAELVNGRAELNDFRVYYGAGQALLEGTPLYGVAHGLDSGLFKYAPALAVIYAPLAALPYPLAATLQYLLITLAFLDALRRTDRLVRERLFDGAPARYAPLFLLGLIVVVHLHRELHLGNINLLLLWLVVRGLEQLVNGRQGWAGALIGLAILTKPHFLVLAPLLALRGQWRVLAHATVLIVLGLLLPAVILGWTANAQALHDWVRTMAEHNGSLIYTGGDDHRAINTIYSGVYRSVLHHFLPASAGVAYALLALIAACFGVFVLSDRRPDGSASHPARFPFEYLLLVGLVPSITLTDTQHFLLAAPVLYYVLVHLFTQRRALWSLAVAIPLFVCYGGNWEDALGPLSDRMIQAGVLGIGSFGLLLVAVLLFLRSNPSRSRTSNPT